MGGDHAPGMVVSGALRASTDSGVKCTLVGDETSINPLLTGEISRNGTVDEIDLVHAPQVVNMSDFPTQIIRKKQSSMAIAYGLVKEGKADAIYSAGNSGALVLGGKRILGLIDGVERPGLLVRFPTLTGKEAIILDAGASTDYKAKDLVVLTLMGKVFVQEVMGIENPSIALLNIGEEAFKGNEAVRRAYKLLKKTDMNFVGNIEGNKIMDGVIDIVVCDGFVGNAILKSSEGTAGFLMSLLREEIPKGIAGKIGGLLLKPAFRRTGKRVDWKERGGGVILGFKGNVFIGHGRSDAKAIQNGLKFSEEIGRADLWSKIEKELSTSEI